MAVTTKSLSNQDFEQVIQYAFNPEERTLAVGSFVAGKVGHRIERTVIDPTTDEYSYYDGSTLLYTLEVVYDNAAHDNVNSVERTV